MANYELPAVSIGQQFKKQNPKKSSTKQTPIEFLNAK